LSWLHCAALEARMYYDIYQLLMQSLFFSRRPGGRSAQPEEGLTHNLPPIYCHSHLSADRSSLFGNELFDSSVQQRVV
jgi:hypothetical protein